MKYVMTVKHIPTWMPGASFKRKALEWRKFSDALSNEPFEEVKKGIVGSTKSVLYIDLTQNEFERHPERRFHL